MAKETKKEEKTVISREMLKETVLRYLKEGLKRDLMLLLFPGVPVAFLVFLLIPKPYGYAAFALLAVPLAVCLILYFLRVKGTREGNLTVRKEIVREAVPGKSETTVLLEHHSFTVPGDPSAEEIPAGSAYYLVFLNEKTKHVFLYYKAKQFTVQ